MPRHSDGPPAGGYRYGSLKALQARLPAKAINPTGAITEIDAQARQNLSKFAAYSQRPKSIGKPLPVTCSTSAGRAAVSKKIDELKQQERAQYQDALIKIFHTNHESREETWEQLEPFIKLERTPHRITYKGLKKIRVLLCNKGRNAYWFLERNMFTGYLQRSIDYGSLEQAMIYNDTDRIHFC
jgi:hypothetical protein